jgi:hypothetical protein
MASSTGARTVSSRGACADCLCLCLLLLLKWLTTLRASVRRHAYSLIRVAEVPLGDGESVRLLELRNPFGNQLELSLANRRRQATRALQDRLAAPRPPHQRRGSRRRKDLCSRVQALASYILRSQSTPSLRNPTRPLPNIWHRACRTAKRVRRLSGSRTRSRLAEPGRLR